MTETSKSQNLPKASDQKARDNYYEEFEKVIDKENIIIGDTIKNKSFDEYLNSIFGNSPFLSSLVLKYPALIVEAFERDFKGIFLNLMTEIEDFQTSKRDKVEKFLRIKKQQMALLIASAEILEIWDSQKAMERLSEFADICVKKAFEFLLMEAHSKKAIILNDEDNPLNESGLVVVAVGKLGSFELNYSSDIDICVFFEEDKIQYLGKMTLGHFFVKASQDLIDILSKRTQDGYVFRTDMRLRPDPASNPLAITIEKAEKYYYTVGQNWERCAMIKARQVCGDLESGKRFFNFMDKNVWRKALDFETIEDIHSIKRQIDTKQGIHPENLFGYNVKLGKGGIREVEFYCQTQQLIWGGRKHSLRVKKTINALNSLFEEEEIEEAAKDELSDAYLFFRFVEHRLQMVNDEQTHKLPKSEENFERISIFCGFDDVDKFKQTLVKHINNVTGHYSKLFDASPSLASQIPEAQGNLVFTGSENDPETVKTLEKLGFEDGAKISEIIHGWHHGRYPCTLKKRSRAVLTKLMPILISSFAKSPYPDTAFIRFDDFLSKLTEESQIFSMLYLNPSIMDLISEIMGAYNTVSANLNKNPDLLDYVLAPEFYNILPDIKYLENNLSDAIEQTSNHLDDKIEVIKDWADDRKFRLGIQLIREEAETDDIQTGLSNIAEVVITTLLTNIHDDLSNSLGNIEGGNFAVIALGKMGSREMTFRSDLDLVFVYEHPDSIFSATGGSNLTPEAYYLRFASKLVYGLTSITRTGKMYEVDLRLRPLGDAGPIATSIESYDEYFNPYKEEGSAWIWEYMALCRSRVFATSQEFEERVSDLILSKLQFNWTTQQLQEGTANIYKRYRDNKEVKTEYDIKNLEGGLFDLEFMIRFLQISQFSSNPDIHAQDTNETIQKLLASDVIENDEATQMVEAFKLYSSILNILRITSEVEISNYTKSVICKIIGIKNETQLNKKLEFTAKNIKLLFKKYLDFL